MVPVAGRIVFVEDSLARVVEIQRLLNLYRSGEAVRAGEPVPRLVTSNEEYWDPITALQRISGGAQPDEAPGSQAEVWDADDQLYMDCWDRDAMDPAVSISRSTFYALDLLRALRGAREAGRTVPRVVVHSRGMNDDLMRAALAEFTVTRRKVRVEGATPLVRWRLDEHGDTAGAVIWAMFSRVDLERNLDLIIGGDRSEAMDPPDAHSAVWTQILPTSCLASFHCAIRDECPEAWEAFVLRSTTRGDGSRVGRLDSAAVARVTRAAHRYLELNDAWGARGHKGYLAIARMLANPEF